MKKPTTPLSGSKWFWILTLLVLLIVVIVWFADPLGKVNDVSAPEPAAQPTDLVPAPEGPAVDVKLPETRMRNPAANQTEAAGN